MSLLDDILLRLRVLVLVDKMTVRESLDSMRDMIATHDRDVLDKRKCSKRVAKAKEWLDDEIEKHEMSDNR